MSTAEPTDPYLGKTIAEKYKILERIGGGGMGAVYKARHELMNRHVALKIIHPKFAIEDNSEFMTRFIREAQTSSKIEHPNAIPIYDYGIDSGIPYLVMKHLGGKTLGEIISKEAPLDPLRIENIFHQISAALTAAHRLGIVHRDLKPDNIMISNVGDCDSNKDGTEKATVLDFGIAKLISPNNVQTTLTETGRMIGTPKYMSPEQIRGRNLDQRSDIYSLGIIVYEMICGKIPFDSDSFADLLVSHLSEAPPSISQRVPNLALNRNLETIVLKALEKDAKLRPKSVKKFADNFSAAIREPSGLTQNESLWKKPVITVPLILGATAAVAFYIFPLSDSDSPATRQVTVVSKSITSPAPKAEVSPAPGIEVPTRRELAGELLLLEAEERAAKKVENQAQRLKAESKQKAEQKASATIPAKETPNQKAPAQRITKKINRKAASKVEIAKPLPPKPIPIPTPAVRLIVEASDQEFVPAVGVSPNLFELDLDNSELIEAMEEQSFTTGNGNTPANIPNAAPVARQSAPTGNNQPRNNVRGGNQNNGGRGGGRGGGRRGGGGGRGGGRR